MSESNQSGWLALCLGMILTLGWCARPASAVVPGGIYSADESMNVRIPAGQWSTKLGYHVVHGTMVYHGRQLPLATGVFLPPAFFHSTDPLPIVVALHNRFAIGATDNGAIIGEGMGRLLGRGGNDERMEGDKARSPLNLRQDAQFIGLVPQCPAGFIWESPQMTKMICNMIAMAVSTYRADDDRIYLTGFSYGASCTWRIAMLAPEQFAAIICCDSRATPDPTHDIEKLKNMGIYLAVGQWDGQFLPEVDRMHQAMDAMPHRNFIFRMIPGGNHFCYEAVYNDPQVWKWVFLQRRSINRARVATN